MRLIVITGTPGTGKSTVAEKAARRIKGALLIRANDIVKEKRLFSKRDREGTMIVKMAPLRREILKIIAKSRSRVLIIEGHLLCEFGIRGATAVVLREHLSVLMRRFRRRGYSGAKIRENIVSEAIDYCGVNAASHYGNVVEMMGDDSAIAKVVRIANGGKVKSEYIEQLRELEEISHSSRLLAD